jgi:hypothetical protein
MLAMNRKAANANVSPPRRFILLPEDTADGRSQGGRIRRYKLTSLGQGAGRGRAWPDAGIPAASGAHRAGRAQAM